MYASDVHAGRRKRSGRLRDVVSVDEHQWRFDGRRVVIVTGFRGGGGVRVTVIQVHSVQVQAHVVQPPVERVGHGVRGEQGGRVGRVAVVAERGGLDPRQQGRGNCVDQRHAQPAGHVRRALAAQRFRDVHVELVAAVGQQPVR